jgi:photosystem II stability/assembly factor-like uncharacterized protein
MTRRVSGDAGEKLALPTIRNLNTISFFDQNRGFVIGDSGTILYTSNGGQSPVGV